MVYLLDFNKVKTKGERTGLDCAKVSIEQVPVCTCIIVNGISDDTTHDAIKLNFESPRNSGGPVETVHFVPKSGLAVVVFQDPRGSWLICNYGQRSFPQAKRLTISKCRLS